MSVCLSPHDSVLGSSRSPEVSNLSPRHPLQPPTARDSGDALSPPCFFRPSCSFLGSPVDQTAGPCVSVRRELHRMGACWSRVGRESLAPRAPCESLRSFAAGAMLWVAVFELILDALKEIPIETCSVSISCSFVAMMAISSWYGNFSARVAVIYFESNQDKRIHLSRL